jgi:hypothetical protein
VRESGWGVGGGRKAGRQAHRLAAGWQAGKQTGTTADARARPGKAVDFVFALQVHRPCSGSIKAL